MINKNAAERIDFLLVANLLYCHSTASAQLCFTVLTLALAHRLGGPSGNGSGAASAVAAQYDLSLLPSSVLLSYLHSSTKAIARTYKAAGALCVVVVAAMSVELSCRSLSTLAKVACMCKRNEC